MELQAYKLPGVKMTGSANTLSMVTPPVSALADWRGKPQLLDTGWMGLAVQSGSGPEDGTGQGEMHSVGWSCQLRSLPFPTWVQREAPLAVLS